MSKAKKFDKLVVVDLEATCWDDNSPKPEGEQSEVIEIGIAILNLQTLLVEGSEGIIVKPVKSKISRFCTELTSITQEMVDEGVSLESAMETMKSKYQIHKRTMAAWGDYDKRFLTQDCADKGIEFPGVHRSYINIKNLLTVECGLEREFGLDGAVELFGLQFEGRHHRGVDDAINVAKIYSKYLQATRKAIKGLV